MTNAVSAAAAPAGTIIAQHLTAAGKEVATALEQQVEHGGTVTHHHAVGRVHMPWYERQRPALFGEALASAKRRLDPKGVLNPGVIVPSSR